MLVPLVSALGSFLLASAASATIGQIAHDSLASLFGARHGKSIACLYVKAFNRALAAWEPTIARESGTTAVPRLDDQAVEEFLLSRGLDVISLSGLTESELTSELAKSISKYLILPGHSLTTLQLEDLATRVIRDTAELLVEEIASDERAFRLAVLQEARVQAYDHDAVAELLKSMPDALRNQVRGLDKKLDTMMSKIAELTNTLARREGLGVSDAEDLRRLCARSVLQALTSIPKYSARLYVHRESAERQLSGFLRSFEPAVVLFGEAGTGKTNLVCHLARSYANRLPTLLFRATGPIAGRLGIQQLIADELSSLVGQRVDAARTIELLNTVLAAGDTYLLVFLDAINENRDVTFLKESLGYAVQDFEGTRIKLFATCRDVDWRFFDDEARFVRHLYVPNASLDSDLLGLRLGVFEERELDHAWANYSRYYELKGTLPTAYRGICRHPLMLQFLCEAFRGRKLPFGLHRKEIFDRYWADKILPKRGRALEEALYALVKEFYSRRVNEISETDAVHLIGQEAYSLLLSRQVVIYTYLDRALGQNVIGFTYDAFFEYALARYLRLAWMWTGACDAEVLADIVGLAALAREYRTVPGAIGYLLLFPEGERTVDRVFPQLTALDESWKPFICDVIAKLDPITLSATLMDYLVKLAGDPAPRVRWGAGRVLGLVGQRGGRPAGTWLESLVRSPDWRKREAAAYGVACSDKTVADALGILARLGLDINWRVRRAAGYALGSVCAERPREAFRFLSRWSRARSCRIRWCVAKALKGLLPESPAAVSLAAEMSGDVSPDVRWLIVINLVTIARCSKRHQLASEPLRRLACDPDAWVRKHVATWLPDLLELDADLAAALLAELLRDPDSGVRWELSRSLGKAAKTLIAREALVRLAADPAEEVRLSAGVSLAKDGTGRSAAAPVPADLGGLGRMRLLRESVARGRAPRPGTGGREPDLYSTWSGDRYAKVMEVVDEEAALLSTSGRVREFLELLCKDEDEGVRWAVASALSVGGTLPGTDTIRILRRLLGDRHYWVQREAASSLHEHLARSGRRLSGRLSSDIRHMAESTNPEVRYASLRCLLALAEERDRNRYVHMALADEDRQIRELATWHPNDG